MEPVRSRPVGAEPDTASAQINALAQRLSEECRGEPAWLLLAAHLTSLVNVTDEMPQVRPSFAKALRNLAVVLDALGDAQGAEAQKIVLQHAPLFDPEGRH